METNYDFTDGKSTKGTHFHLDNELFAHDKSLNANEMIYLTEFKMYGEEHADKMLLKLISRQTLKRLKNKLIEKGKIPKAIKITPEKAKEFTIKMSHKGSKCEWCGQECYILNKHHFPISAKDGGTETVDICPNCHYTFHNIIGR